MRLTGTLQIDDSRIRRELAWQPRYTPAQGLAGTCRWYHSQSGA
jgi:nucleoside-diphosphate-sugar epimerase